VTEPVDPSVLEQANEADVQEQAQEQAPDTPEGDEGVLASSSNEVDDFDASEQGRVVELDPEEYR
jgi:hypothetical protein